MFCLTLTQPFDLPFQTTAIVTSLYHSFTAKKFLLLGYGVGYDDIVITGDVNEGKFCAYYTSGNYIIAVATMMSDPVAADVAQHLLAGQKLRKSDLLKKATANNHH